jgi:spermidine synthase
MYIGQPFRTRFAYTDYLQLGLAYNPSAKNVLVVGLGGASAPKRVWRDFGDVRLTVVELDPAVVETAYKWFALPHDERIDVHVDDGRRYLQRNDDRYDVIMLDAFYADGVPFHMTTLEFVELLRERLTPGGVVAVNVIGALTGSGSRITRALWKTYASVFPTVVFHPVYEGAFDRTPSDVRNIILVATERAAPSRDSSRRRGRRSDAPAPRGRRRSRARSGTAGSDRSGSTTCRSSRTATPPRTPCCWTSTGTSACRRRAAPWGGRRRRRTARRRRRA